MSAEIFSHCDKAWPLYFLIDKEGKDFLLFKNYIADFV